MSGIEWEAIHRRRMEQRQSRARSGQAMSSDYPYWIDRDPETKTAHVNWRRAAYVMRAITM